MLDKTNLTRRHSLPIKALALWSILVLLAGCVQTRPKSHQHPPANHHRLPQNSKQAFCVQSTSRFSNNEATPLDHNYSCRLQGIQAGWVDEYVAGLDTQWVDITGIDIPSEGLLAELTFTSNGDRFLCEGAPVLDENGEPVWEPSGFMTDDGEEIMRPKCDFIPDWDANNISSREVFLPQRLSGTKMRRSQ